jgi:hypothetical protein
LVLLPNAFVASEQEIIEKKERICSEWKTLRMEKNKNCNPIAKKSN